MSEEIKPKKERRFLKTLGRVGEILVEQVLLKLGSSIIRKIGGKKTLPSILFIFLSLSLFAQFPNTLNKQRLGFQTTADGLVWRGSISDTSSIQPINNQNAWVILDTINLKFYTFDFTSNVWNLVGGAAFAQPVDSLFFNVNVPTNNVDTAKMRWDSDLATVVLGLNDNVPNEIGFKNFWLVKNQTGSTITKGSLVYANGTVGASGRITVDKFIANGSIDAKFLLGITAHDLTDGEDGYVISFGKIRQVNTDTFAAGAILYPSPTVAGVWTDVEPVAPNIDMPIGFCINSSVNNGTIAIRVASGYKLSELHDVSITSPLEKASLYYSGGLWRDTTAALLVSDTASMLTPYLRKADTTNMLLPYFRDADTSLLNLTSRFANKLNISDTASMLTPYLRKADTTNMLLPYFRDADTTSLNLTSRFATKLNISDTSVFARDNQISGTSGQVAYFNSSNSVISDAGLIYNATNNSLGINTTTTSGANLIIKNSQEPVRDTFVTTQTFAADTTNWTRGAGWTFNGTQAVATGATGDLTYTPSLTITSGNAYEITYTLTNYTGGTLSVRLGNGTAIVLPTYNVTNFAVVTLPTTSTGGFRFTTSSFTGNLDNVRIMQITGSAPVLLAGQDDGAATLYNSLRMPNSTTLAFGGGGARTTGTNNNFFGNNTGQNNTTGINNNFYGQLAGQFNISGSGNSFFGTQAGRNNITGGQNNFFGELAGLANATGSANNFFGSAAGRSNLTGGDNNFFGTNSGFANTTGSNNNFFGISTGRSNTTGSSNIAIGNAAMYNTTVGDTLAGSNNIAIGTNAGDNIEFAAAGNVAIGNGIDFPDPSGSNQVAIKNVYFATGASGAGTGIAALSKAGIKTNAPNRDLEVAGEVRITDLTTDAPTRLVGADADGDLGQVTLGAGLSLASSSLFADTSFLVTRFDTAAMLTNYLRSGTAASTYLPLTGGTLTGGLTGTSATFSGNVAIGFPAAFKPFEVKSNANDYVSVGVVDGLNNFQYSGVHFGFREANTDYRKSAIVFQRNEIGAADASGRIHILNVNSGNLGRSANLSDAKITIGNNGGVGINDTTPSFTLDVNGTLNATGATTLGSTLAVNSNGVPFTVNSTNSNSNKISLSDNGTIRSYLGANNTKLFTVANPSTTELMFIDNNGVNRINASGVPMQINSTNSNINKIAFYDAGANTGYIASSSMKPFIVNNSSTTEVASISDAGNASFAGNITESGNNVLNNLDTVSLSSRIDSKFNSSGGTISGAVTLSTTTATPSSLLGKSTGNVVGNVRLTSPLALAGDSLNLGTVPISKGGTGAESASVARTTLGVDYIFYSTTTGATISFSSNRVSLVITGTGLTTTIDLSTATSGRQYMIKNLSNATVVSGASNVIPLAGGSATTAILSAGNVTPQWVTLIADGTNWHVMQKN